MSNLVFGVVGIEAAVAMTSWNKVLSFWFCGEEWIELQLLLALVDEDTTLRIFITTGSRLLVTGGFGPSAVKVVCERMVMIGYDHWFVVPTGEIG